MAPTTRLLGAAILFCSLVVTSSRDLRRRSMIEEVADGCRVGKTPHYVCCFECETCRENGVDVPSCRGRRILDNWGTKRDMDVWMQRRLADYFDTKKRGAVDYWDDKRDTKMGAADYWDDKRDTKRGAADYWDDKRDTKMGAADYWDSKREVDYWQEKRAPRCRVMVEDGMHRCCARRNGCACPKDVVWCGR